VKKIIAGLLIFGCVLLASDKTVELKSNLFDVNKIKSEEMRNFLIALELVTPSATKIVKDYFEAKTCSKEFYNKVTVDDIKKFLTTKRIYGILFELSSPNSDKKEVAKGNRYIELISIYQFMNCGKGALKITEMPMQQ